MRDPVDDYVSGALQERRPDRDEPVALGRRAVRIREQAIVEALRNAGAPDPRACAGNRSTGNRDITQPGRIEGTRNDAIGELPNGDAQPTAQVPTRPVRCGEPRVTMPPTASEAPRRRPANGSEVVSRRATIPPAECPTTSNGAPWLDELDAEASIALMSARNARMATAPPPRPTASNQSGV